MSLWCRELYWTGNPQLVADTFDLQMQARRVRILLCATSKTNSICRARMKMYMFYIVSWRLRWVFPVFRVHLNRGEMHKRASGRSGVAAGVWLLPFLPEFVYILILCLEISGGGEGMPQSELFHCRHSLLNTLTLRTVPTVGAKRRLGRPKNELHETNSARP